MPEWVWHVLWWATVGIVSGWLGWGMIRNEMQHARDRADLLAEIKARPRPILWITEDGVIHTTCDDAAVTADYLEACAAAVRAAPPTAQEASDEP